MDCAQCGQAVSEGAVSCGNCGAAVGSAGGSAPPEPPPRSRRTLIWVLVGIAGLFLIVAGGALALILPAGQQTGVSPTPSVAEVVTPSTTTSAPTQTTGSGGTATTNPAQPSGGHWVEMAAPVFEGKAQEVAVSDEALVVVTAKGLYASPIDGSVAGAPVKLPVSGGKAGSPALEGTLVAWWQGTRDETSKIFVDQAIYVMRLPDGSPLRVVGPDRSPYYPQLSDGYLTWVQPEPENGDANADVWIQPIYGVAVDGEGSPQGEPELLTSTPRAYVLGGQAWTYSFDGSLLAWEQQWEAEGLGTGVHLMDRTTGETTQLSSQGGRPSVAGRIVTYFGEALEGIDLTDDREWTIDTRGDWATAAEDYVVYLRGVRRQRFWEIVARRFDDDSEQVLARQAALPWAAPPLAASKNHIAYVADDGTVKLFEWRTD